MPYPIEKDVKIPPVARKPKIAHRMENTGCSVSQDDECYVKMCRVANLMATMNKDDSFLVPYGDLWKVRPSSFMSALWNRIYRMRRQGLIDGNFTMRMVDDGIRIWRFE